MSKKITVAIIWLCWFSLQGVAQDPQFSQFYANQVALTPAFTGLGIGPRLAFNYRSQWVAIPGHYKTFATAFDMPLMFGPERFGIGLSAMVDQAGAGDLTKLDLLFNAAYHLPFNDYHMLSMGFSGGIQQASIDFFNLRFPNQIDPLNPDASKLPHRETPRGSQIREDLSFGLLYQYNFKTIEGGIWGGVTASHLTQPKQTLVEGAMTTNGMQLPLRISVFAGCTIPLTSDKLSSRSITPSIMYRMQNPFNQLDIGCYVNLDPVVFGLYFRAFEPDAIIPLIGLRKGMFKVGYSYDFTISTLTNGVSGGAHEVSLVVEFEQKRKSRAPKVNINCPKF